MGEFITEGEFYLTAIFVFFLCGIATFLFGRISVKYIEGEMAKEGIESPVWDKGIGARLIMYAMVIAANKSATQSPVDDESILRHTRKKDKNLAWFFIFTTVIMFLLIVVHSIFFPL